MASDKTKGGIDPLTGQPKTALYTEDTGVQRRVQERIEAQRRLWSHKCECSCNCGILHPGRERVCVLCLTGDHWENLASYLDKIARRSA